MRMVEIMTDPERFREYILKQETKNKQQRKACLDYYHRNKAELNAKRKEKYAETHTTSKIGRPKKQAAEGPVQTV